MKNSLATALLWLSLASIAAAAEKSSIAVRFSEEGRIEQVFPGGAAEKAGLAVGDVVRRVGGENITSIDQLLSLIRDQAPNSMVTFVVDRNGEKKEIVATMARRTVKLFLTQRDPPRVTGGMIQLDGGGIAGDVDFGGNMVVDSPSRIEGNFTHGWNGVLDLRVAAGKPPLLVTGDMHLDGMLHIRLAEGLMPKLGERFKIIAGAKSLSGRFEELSLPAPGERLGWRVEYDNVERKADTDDDGLYDVTIVVVNPDTEMPPVEP